LGNALQIGCLRYLGFFPEDLSQIPHVVIEYVAAQLGVIPELLAFYGKRTSTQRHHQRQIQKLLGYRRASAANIVELEQWLLERALEHDKPTLLFTMACEFLKCWLYRANLCSVRFARFTVFSSHSRFSGSAALSHQFSQSGEVSQSQEPFAWCH
jgi:hypothetical protein